MSSIEVPFPLISLESVTVIHNLNSKPNVHFNPCTRHLSDDSLGLLLLLLASDLLNDFLHLLLTLLPAVTLGLQGLRCHQHALLIQHVCQLNLGEYTWFYSEA